MADNVVEQQTHPSRVYRSETSISQNLIENFREKLHLPQYEPNSLLSMSRISGAATETVIRTGLIGQKATRTMLAVTSNLGNPSGLSASTPEEVKQIKSAEMSPALEYFLRKPMTPWERYRLFFLNG